MSRSLIPGLFLPRPHLATADQSLNNDALLRWSKSVSPRMLAVGLPIVGTNPPTPPSDAYVSQMGRAVVTFTGTDPYFGTMTLPLAFPNGWLSLQVVSPFEYEVSGATLQTVILLGTAASTYGVDFQAVGW